MAEPDPEQEALRLKSLAEAKFESSDIKSALKYAKRAQRLSPKLAGLSEMIMCFKTLHAAADESTLPDYYRVLQVEPFSQINTIRKQYKKLALSLHPDKNSSLGSEEAFKVVGDAFRVLSDRIRRKEYDLKLRIRMQEEAVDGLEAAEMVETFWSACSQCKLLHQFERKYLRHNLVCPSCRKSFRAVEIGDDEEEREGLKERPKRKASTVEDSRSKNREGSGDELTLAEMQLQAKRRANREKIKLKEKEIANKAGPSDVEAQGTSNKDPNSRTGTSGVLQNAESNRQRDLEKNDKSLKVYSRGTWRKKKTAELAVERPADSKIRQVEDMMIVDSDFYDFDKDRMEKSFKKGQVWATYNDADGMPRHYCLIEEVMSTNPFEVRVSWLDPQDKKAESDMPCGRFKVSRKCTLRSVNLFSHVVDSERAAREIYRIYPRKGSVWALYRTNKCSYDIVIFLTTYSEIYGLSMAYLEKVDGFKTVFKRQEIGARAVRLLEKDGINMCSHQVPARKILGDEVPGHLQGCWELDPASLPLDVLILPKDQ